MGTDFGPDMLFGKLSHTNSGTWNRLCTRTFIETVIIIFEKSTSILKPLPHSHWSRLVVAARDARQQLERARGRGRADVEK